MKALALALLSSVLLVGCGSEKKPLDGPERLQGLIEDLYAAATTGDPESARGMASAFLLSDYETWYGSVFGSEIGARLAVEYKPLADRIETLPGLFKELQAHDQTGVSVERYDDPDDPLANGYQATALRAMQRPVALYSVRFVKPGDEQGIHLWSFVNVDGAFRFAGMMKSVNPTKRAPQLDRLGEMRRKDAEALMSGN